MTSFSKLKDSITLENEDLSIPGSTMVLSGFLAFMGIITAEVLYPGYSTLQDISDLGSTRPPNPVIMEPSATIFNSTMILTGALIMISAFFIYRRMERHRFPLALAIFGFGAFGVGVFPGNMTPWHGLFALLTFFSGGITVILSSRTVTRPFSLICGLLGTVSLLMLMSAILYGVTGISHPLSFLGMGGIERWVVYPLILWTLAYGGYISGSSIKNENKL